MRFVWTGVALGSSVRTGGIVGEVLGWVVLVGVGVGVYVRSQGLGCVMGLDSYSGSRSGAVFVR